MDIPALSLRLVELEDHDRKRRKDLQSRRKELLGATRAEIPRKEIVIIFFWPQQKVQRRYPVKEQKITQSNVPRRLNNGVPSSMQKQTQTQLEV